ncbi:MAG: hypothetical protein D6814_11085 [Calditrichaeota bacterium]|nr:MAG: hypothetical protein D6814_11085 [Calditrichota bacterium]
MKLNILSQIIEAYHDFVVNDTNDYRNDFDSPSGEVEDPMGGIEGVTDYDSKNVDEDYNC